MPPCFDRLTRSKLDVLHVLAMPGVRMFSRVAFYSRHTRSAGASRPSNARVPHAEQASMRCR